MPFSTGGFGGKGFLASHRFMRDDYHAMTGNYVHATYAGGYANRWKLERIGDFEHHKYIISLANNVGIGDRVDTIGWAMTPEVPTDVPTKDWCRDENSCYVYCSSFEHHIVAPGITPPPVN